MKVILKTSKNGQTVSAKLYNTKEAAEKAGKAFMNEVTMVKRVKEQRAYKIVKA